MSDGKFRICMTFDPDAISLWVTTFKSKDPSLISRGEYDIAVGLPRVLRLLERNDIRATFFVPGHTALAYPDAVRSIRDGGHEIGHHGWVHENPADFDPSGERDILERGFAALERVAGVRPQGYRSPSWVLSPNTIEILQEVGLVYDSSCMGNDFDPYYLRIGDRWSSANPYKFGPTSGLVEMPATWLLDDFVAFEFVWGYQEGLRRPRDVEELWREEFDYGLANCPGGLLTLTMHPQVIGRGSRINMLQRLIKYLRDQPNVEFVTLGEGAEQFKKANPLEEWKAANPVYTGANAITDFPA